MPKDGNLLLIESSVSDAQRFAEILETMQNQVRGHDTHDNFWERKVRVVQQKVQKFREHRTEEKTKMLAKGGMTRVANLHPQPKRSTGLCGKRNFSWLLLLDAGLPCFNAWLSTNYLDNPTSQIKV